MDALEVVTGRNDHDWISVSELARRRGVSCQAVRKAVHRHSGGEVLISVAAYERVTGVTMPPPLSVR
jgi:hypothetical protein